MLGGEGFPSFRFSTRYLAGTQELGDLRMEASRQTRTSNKQLFLKVDFNVTRKD